NIASVSAGSFSRASAPRSLDFPAANPFTGTSALFTAFYLVFESRLYSLEWPTIKYQIFDIPHWFLCLFVSDLNVRAEFVDKLVERTPP
ncbi:MAG: hypothetical protein OXU92_04215, partial [Deltaproteobacteria bacterium]|nr:hypothetical protein [Deltaproteobacteria bacterium]